MNDEIKEILDIMKKCYDLKDENFDNYITLYQLGLLLDYITNLQQENERLKENNSDMQEEMARTWEKCEDYKSRCEKAIEYIKNNDLSFYPNEENLLNILQNGSDSQ